MPKGVQNMNQEILERLRAKVAQSLSFSLNSNKSYNLLSNIIFDRTGALLSNSTLRRVFQYDSVNNPTKSTLDLICKSIGFNNWDDFVEKEKTHSQSDLSQVITIFRLQGIRDHAQTFRTLEKYSDHPDFFNLLDDVVQIAISNRDIEFLSKIFDLEDAFKTERNPILIIYFIHKLVIGLNKSGLMPRLIELYGANPRAHAHLIESFVDEDNMNGYFYDLMQVYHKHKKTPEAQLFYHCLMYQYTLENEMATTQHLDFIRQFSDAIPIHNLPKGRRFAILMLETNDMVKTIPDILNNTRSMFHTLNDIARLTTALYMVKLLFIKRKDELIENVLSLTPESDDIGKNIDDLTNINQIKIYKAYSLYQKGEKENALRKLKEFDPLLVHAFIYNHIMNDYRVISDLVTSE